MIKSPEEKQKRETNTMPQWAGSCWYFLRYLDPDNENALCDINKEKFWMPVNLYIGGAGACSTSFDLCKILA
ncbi:MAG: hypothetical protein R2942_08290 [Ignavibacteria bacterium]